MQSLQRSDSRVETTYLCVCKKVSVGDDDIVGIRARVCVLFQREKKKTLKKSEVAF